MLSREHDKISPAEYLSMERCSEIRNEYFDGEIFAMAGASREHNQISSNVVRVIGNQLLEKPCNIYSSDMKVKVKMKEIEKYTYPDIVIACETETYADDNNDVLLNPVVIMEILSGSTEAYDRGAKFAHYQLLDSLVDYILISQYLRQVEIFTRRDDDTWIYSKYATMEDVVTIASIHCELSLSEIYRKVTFDRRDVDRNFRQI